MMYLSGSNQKGAFEFTSGPPYLIFSSSMPLLNNSFATTTDFFYDIKHILDSSRPTVCPAGKFALDSDFKTMDERSAPLPHSRRLRFITVTVIKQRITSLFVTILRSLTEPESIFPSFLCSGSLYLL